MWQSSNKVYQENSKQMIWYDFENNQNNKCNWLKIPTRKNYSDDVKLFHSDSSNKDFNEVFTFDNINLNDKKQTDSPFGPIGSPLISSRTPSTIILNQSTGYSSSEEQQSFVVEKKDEVMMDCIDIFKDKKSLGEKNYNTTFNKYVQGHNILHGFKYEDFIQSKDKTSGKIYNNQSNFLFKRLHVSNIPFRFRREHLYNIFSIFGEILDTEIVFNQRGSKGFGFVSFADTDAAYKAKIALNNIVIEGRRIDVNYATPKPPKMGAQMNKNQYNNQQFNFINKLTPKQQSFINYNKKFQK